MNTKHCSLFAVLAALLLGHTGFTAEDAGDANHVMRSNAENSPAGRNPKRTGKGKKAWLNDDAAPTATKSPPPVTKVVRQQNASTGETGDAGQTNGTSKTGTVKNKHRRGGDKSQFATMGGEHKKKNAGTGKHHKQKEVSYGQTQNSNQEGGNWARKGKTKTPPKGHEPHPTTVSPAADPAALSDVRAKTDISFVGWSPMGIPIYRFSYINEPNKRYQGTIAQAISRIRPEAVTSRDGFLFVDYSQLDVEMQELPEPGVPVWETD